MPINETGQGHGASSALKREHFRKFLSVHTRICCGMPKKYPRWTYSNYVYIDLNAGTGFHEEEEGSPMCLFRRVRNNCDAFFVEINPLAATLLEQNIEPFRHSSMHLEVMCGDNKVLLSQICEKIYKQTLAPNCSRDVSYTAYGLMYSDENGIDIPFEEMRHALLQKHMEKIDVLIYVSCTGLKRVLKSMPEKGYKRLSEYIDSMPKSCWHVRQPAGAHQWCFLFGSNWDGYPELTNDGFHRIDTAKGQKILERVTHTAEEMKEIELSRSKFKQQSLFDLRKYG